LRTPLTVIQGAVALLRREVEHGRSTLSHPVLARMEQALEDMSATVNACLWLAREDEPPSLLPEAPVGERLRWLVDTHRPLLGNRPVEVTLHVHVDVLENFPLEGLRLVASNLIRNAFLYTLEGRVEIVLESHQLIVRDTGTGLPPSVAQALRESHPGPGIGLHLTRSVCQRLAWQFHYNPNSPGSTFSVTW